MRATKIVTNLPVSNIDGAKAFYQEFLGLSEEEFNLGWVARFTEPSSGVSVQLVTGDETSPEDSAMSVMVDDVEAAYEEAVARSYDIVHALTTEPWGVRRFLVRSPDGTVVNIVHDHS